VAVLQLVRIENVLFVAVLAWVGLGAGPEADFAEHGLTVIVTITAILAAGNIVNDIIDEKLDRVGKPWRPLPSGRVSRRAAFVLLGATSLVAVVGIGMLPGIAESSLAVFMLAVAFLYSIVLKGVPLVGNLSVALDVALVLLLAAMAADRLTSSMVWVGLVIMNSYLIYEFAKTARDRWHDRLFVKTAAVRWKNDTVWRIFVALVTIHLVLVGSAIAFLRLDPRLLVALALPIVPFAAYGYAHRADRDLDRVGSTVRASKLLFVPTLLAMALWL